MKKILAILLILAFAFGLYHIDKILADSLTLPAVEFSTGDTYSPAVLAVPVPLNDWVKVTGEFVNIRSAAGVATGDYAQAGQELAVRWEDTGYGVILAPAEWRGLLIWRGCTDQPAGYGCEAK